MADAHRNSKSRVCYWQHTQPTRSVDAMAAIVLPHMEAIVSQNEKIYESTDLRAGIDVSILREWDDMLAGGMALDPRGGFFSQDLVEQGVQKALGEAGLEPAFERQACSCLKTPKELLAMVAYKIRVMFSHARRSHSSLPNVDRYMFIPDRARSRTPPRFFVNLDLGEPAEAGGPDNDGVSAALHLEESITPADATLVQKYFDGHKWAAVQLMSDGCTTKASSYVAGENGMVVARWASGDTLELDLPNTCLRDGELLKYAPPLQERLLVA